MQSPRYRTYILTALCLLCANAATAQRVLTIDDARAAALEWNKDVRRSALTRRQTMLEARALRSNFFPRLSLSLADFYSTARGHATLTGGHLPIYNFNAAAGSFLPNVTPTPDGTYTLNQYADFPDQRLTYKVKNIFFGGLTLTQPLYMGGKITAAYRMGRIATDIAAEGQRLSESEVLVSVDEAYTQAVRARQLAAVARSYQALLTELLKNVEGGLRHGMRTRNDVLRVQVKMGEAELSVQRADNAYRLARMNLCHLIGQPLDTPIEVTESIAVPTDADLVSGDAFQRPEHAIVSAKADLATHQTRLTRSDYLPHVALLGGYSYANGGELMGRKFADDGSVFVGVNLTVPILTFGERAAKIRSARVSEQMARIDQENDDEQLALYLAQSRNALAEARTELDITSRSLAQAEENLRQARQAYEVGTQTLSDCLEAQALWQQASADLVEARCALFVAVTHLRRATGQLR